MSTVVSNMAGAGGRSPGQHMAVAIAAVLAFLLVALLVGGGILGISGRWSEPEYSHGWLIPAVTAFLLWQRWPRIMAAREAGSWLGVALLVLGLLILGVARAAMSDLPQGIALILILGGLGLAFLGPRAMQLAWMPLVFLLFALPLPARIYFVLSTELQLLSSQIGAGILHALGISVFLDGNVIDLGITKMQVAEACSGLRYLFPLSAFGFLCAWLYRAPLWAKVVVFLSVIPITVVTNSARIALTGIFLEYGNRELAEGFMHLFEGWIIFLVGLLLLFGTMWLLARLWERNAGLQHLLDFDRMAGGVGAVPAARAPLRLGPPALVSVALLVVALVATFVTPSRAAVIPERPGLVTFPLQLGDWKGHSGSVEPEVLKALGADDYLLADFTSPDFPAPVDLWVAYYDKQTDGPLTHSPRECLPGAGWEFVSLETIAAPLTAGDGKGFELNRAVISDGETRMMMYYWYEQGGERFTEESYARLHLLIGSLTTGRTDGALVRLLTPYPQGEDPTLAEARLSSFLKLVYPALEPHVGA